MSTEATSVPKIVDQLGRRFSTAVVLFHSAIAERFGLNATDWKCGEVLSRLGPMNPGQLAEIVGMSTAAMTLVLDRLEQAGFARRERDPHDRRKVIVSPVMSPEMGQAMGEILGGLHQGMAAMLADYTPEQLEVIGNFVQQATLMIEAETARLRKR